MIPIKIAVSRGIKGQSLTTIKVLSWLGLFVGITWFIALIMSLVCEEKANYSSISNLLEKGLITQKEYNDKRDEFYGSKK